MISFKNFSLLITLMVVGLIPAYSQATLDFDSKELKLKNIEEGQLAEGVFTFTNNSDTTIVLSNVRGSCGCTVAKWPKEAIAPQGKGEIKVVYNSMNRPGYYVKSVRVTSAMFKKPIELKVKGFVKKKPVAKEEEGN